MAFHQDFLPLTCLVYHPMVTSWKTLQLPRSVPQVQHVLPGWNQSSVSFPFLHWSWHDSSDDIHWDSRGGHQATLLPVGNGHESRWGSFYAILSEQLSFAFSDTLRQHMTVAHTQFWDLAWIVFCNRDSVSKVFSTTLLSRVEIHSRVWHIYPHHKELKSNGEIWKLSSWGRKS